MKIASYVLKGLLTALFLFSASGKLLANPQAQAGFDHLGFGLKLMLPIGALEVISLLVFVIPTRLEMLGAILLTGYMGGAVVAHLRVGEHPVMQMLIPALVWVAYFLKNPEVLKAAIGKKS